jgi:prolyl-tRNA synthetase
LANSLRRGIARRDQEQIRKNSAVTAIRHALTIKREDDFAQWYQEVISAADMAEESGVRGCMVIKPWGFGIWERMQQMMDRRIKAAGVQNAYFPLLIPLGNFVREAEHVEGFAKEMAVVTHHRLIADGKGGLIPDPEARLEEPLIVRPTSETIIGDAMSRWIQSWRDLPLLLNQWANVVRWEMRTRMFLRTSEFLWQEGHTAHETREDALAETLRALEMYRAFAEVDAAIPVIVGEKPANERFPGAEATYSIEAMMQDGKALQAGTSHYLGTSFAEAANIRFQDREGTQQFCHTTSWGVSTRMVGAMIMVHGDDDGLRVPPTLAPFQVVILPMLREDEGDAALITYCDELRAKLAMKSAFGEQLRVWLDAKPGKAAAKRWDWVRKGAPLIVEVGPRDMAEGKAAVLRRHQLWNEAAKPNFAFMARDDFAAVAPALLEEIQQALFDQATQRREANIVRDIDSLDALKGYFAEDQRYPGWAEVRWSRPEGAALDKVVEQLKALKLTFRNVPLNAPSADGTCLFTGEPAVERIYVARAY